jgi:hypothetical protein
MLKDLDDCLRDDLIFLGLLALFSVGLGLLSLDLRWVLGLDFLEFFGLTLSERFVFLLGAGLLASWSCRFGERFGDLVVLGVWISALTVLLLLLPSSSVCIGWNVSGACDDWMRRAWLPVLPADKVDVVLQTNRLMGTRALPTDLSHTKKRERGRRERRKTERHSEFILECERFF